MSLHVFSCLCCVDADSSVVAEPTRFTVYTEKMNQLMVADQFFFTQLGRVVFGCHVSAVPLYASYWTVAVLLFFFVSFFGG